MISETPVSRLAAGLSDWPLWDESRKYADSERWGFVAHSANVPDHAVGLHE